MTIPTFAKRIKQATILCVQKLKENAKKQKCNYLFIIYYTTVVKNNKIEIHYHTY